MSSPELAEEVLDDLALLRARDPRGLLPAVAGAGAQVRETARLTAEAGEFLDAIKKHAIYGKPLDGANVIEELGDIEFFMERIRQIVGTDRETVLAYNIEKLQVRYGAKYSNEAAQSRKDKQ